jgi:hypothetical protein
VTCRVVATLDSSHAVSDRFFFRFKTLHAFTKDFGMVIELVSTAYVAIRNLGRFGTEKRQERRSEGSVHVGPGQLTCTLKTLRAVLKVFGFSGVRTAELRAILQRRSSCKQSRPISGSQSSTCPHLIIFSFSSCISLDVTDQDSYLNVEKALALCAQHTESLEMLQALKKCITVNLLHAAVMFFLLECTVIP